jgi:hypothetical protein
MVVDLVEMLRTHHLLLNGQDLVILNVNYLSVYKVYAMHNSFVVQEFLFGFAIMKLQVANLFNVLKLWTC